MRIDEDELRRGHSWPALTRQELGEAASDLARAQPTIAAVYLFGSRARNESRPSSDVDLAVLLDKLLLADSRLVLEAELSHQAEEILGVPADVVVLHQGISLPLLFDIFRVETILYARDYEWAHEFACRARGWYREELPRLEWIWRRSAARIQERANAFERP